MSSIKKACHKLKSATGSALEAYQAYSDLGGELYTRPFKYRTKLGNSKVKISVYTAS